MPELRLISDLADPSIDNTVDDVQTDYNIYDVDLRLQGSNQVSFHPGPVAQPNEPPLRPLNALIIEYVEDDDSPDWEDHTYEVLTEDKEIKFVKSLNFDTRFRPTDSVIIYPPVQGDQWRIVNEKTQALEQYSVIDGTIEEGAISLEKATSLRLNGEEADDFETLTNNTIVLPVGYYDIRIRINGMSVIVVAMEQTGGTTGDENTQCSWTYTIKNANTDEELETDYDPLVDGKWTRPTVGPLLAATDGLWRNGKLYWCNETLDSEAC